MRSRPAKRRSSRGWRRTCRRPCAARGSTRASSTPSPSWSNEALAAGLSIAIELDSGPGLWVNARPYELREVFTNLILNSADAMPSGGAIRLSAREQNGRVLASVEDDGLGMNDETRDRMFEPFFTTKGESGTGLGMSVAYGIVQRHGGQIAVSSQPGRGTRVEVSLPVTSARPVQAPARRAPAPPAATGPMEVLVIDDEDAVRDLLADIVGSLGHQVTARANGVQALENYVPGRFQLVLTDIGMPGLTGWQVAGMVRATDPDVMLAFVTGWAEDVSRDALERARVDAV